MLEFLKTILGDAYTEEIDGKISAEIGKGFVARSDFNELSSQKKKLEQDVKTRDTQLEELKKSSGDVESLKQQITQLQTQNAEAQKTYEAQLAKLKLDSAVDAALTTAGAKNNVAAKALLADFLKDAKLSDDGTVEGLSKQLESLVKSDETSFLFNSADTSQQFKGMTPGNSGGNTTPAGTTYESRLAEARKTGNTAAAVAIKREAADNGVFLM